jgi:mono/diheme cytochrome c family protein
MFGIHKLQTLVIAGTFLFAVWPLRDVAAEPFPAPGDFARGAQSWADNCVRCHNMRDPRDLRDDQWVTTVFHMRVRAGLTGQQSRDILTFLQGSNTRAVALPIAQTVPVSVSADAVPGEQTYKQTCIACHGANGKGAVPGAPNLTNPSGPLSKADAELIERIINGFQSEGSPMAMPPKGGNPSLTEADIQNVVEYMKASFGTR